MKTDPICNLINFKDGRKAKQAARKAKNVNILFTKLFFCHTESKNVATTLICATGRHTKNHGLLVAQLL